MSDLSTFAGQAAHYRDVHDRLMGGDRRLEPRAPKPHVVGGWTPKPTKVSAPARQPPKSQTPRRSPPYPGSGWHWIARRVCERHGVSLKDVLSVSRVRKISAARQEICYRLCVDRPELSKAQIGMFLHVDATTVLYHHRQYALRLTRKWRADA